MDRKHFCTIEDRFVYSDDLAVEMRYVYAGQAQWRCRAVIVGVAAYSEVCIYEAQSDAHDLGDMMREHRHAVDAVLMRLASLVGIKTAREELR